MATAKVLQESSNSSSSKSSNNNMSTEERQLLLCSLVDSTFDKIHELQDLLSQESDLLGVDVKSETLDPILKKQRSLMSRIASLQKSRGISSSRKYSHVVRDQPHSPSLSSGSGGTPGNSHVFGHGDVKGTESRMLPQETPVNSSSKREAVSSRSMLSESVDGRLKLQAQLRPDEKYSPRTPNPNFEVGLPPTALHTVQSSLFPFKHRNFSPVVASLGKSSSSLGPSLSSEVSQHRGVYQGAASMLCLKMLEDRSPNFSQTSFYTANDTFSNNNSVQEYSYSVDESLIVKTPKSSDDSLQQEMQDMMISHERPDSAGNARQNETSKPFEMSDFYKYSSKWKRFVDETSHKTAVVDRQPSVLDRKDDIIARLKRIAPAPEPSNPPGILGGPSDNQSSAAEPPLPPRLYWGTTAKANQKEAIRPVLQSDGSAWVMDKPTIV